jgi:hypothetical protein
MPGQVSESDTKIEIGVMRKPDCPVTHHEIRYGEWLLVVIVVSVYSP